MSEEAFLDEGNRKCWTAIYSFWTILCRLFFRNTGAAVAFARYRPADPTSRIPDIARTARDQVKWTIPRRRSTDPGVRLVRAS